MNKLSSSIRQEAVALRRLAGAAAAVAAFGVAGVAQSAVITIPQSALVPSTQLYTDDIGGGIGTALIMTGGGHEANVGGTSNDDGFSGPINFGFNFTLFGTTYTSFYANNNGNISFLSGIAEFTPTGLQGATQPVISPFFADVDTRDPDSGVMSLRFNTTANGDEVIITWPNVGFYNQIAPPTNTFQLVVRADNYNIPTGEGQVGFFWGRMDWEVGQASGGNASGLCTGTGGLGTNCVPAAVGFGDGVGNGYVLEGSTLNGIANVVENHRLWVRLTSGGVPDVPGRLPEPGSLALAALALGAAVTMRARRRMGR